jgi:hypothetical protein
MRPEDVKNLVDSVRRHASVWLDNEVESSVRLYLLHGRLEPVKVLRLRHYLEVSVPLHRHTLTRLLLADHPLAVEQLRRASRYHAPVPYNLRLCRLCRLKVETPEHVLLLCTRSEALCDLRLEFQIALQRHNLPLPFFHDHNAVTCLQKIVYNRSSIDIVAKFVYDALAIVEQTPLYRP